MPDRTSRTPSIEPSSTARRRRSIRSTSARRPPPSSASSSRPGRRQTLRLRLRLGSAADGAARRRSVRRLRGDVRRPDRRGRRVLRRRSAASALSADERLVQRQAFAGLIWCKQFYHYDVNEWLDGDPADPPPAVAPGRPQCRVARVQLQGHPVDARQLGVPLVRGLGPRLPLRRPGGHRPGLRQGPAAPADPRVVHAPERPAAGLRVALRRRQPAGPRLGRLAGLPDRAARRRARATCASSSGSSTSSC